MCFFLMVQKWREGIKEATRQNNVIFTLLRDLMRRVVQKKSYSCRIIWASSVFRSQNHAREKWCFAHLSFSRSINVLIEIYSNYIHAFNERKQKVLPAASENFNLLCFSFWDFMVAFLVQLLCLRACLQIMLVQNGDLSGTGIFLTCRNECSTAQ